MMKTAMIVAGALAVSAGGAARAEPPLKSVAIELPQTSATFPGGDKADTINANCLTCHSAEMVLDQPSLPKDEWAKEVTKMRKVYAAPVRDEDVPAIVDYLATLKPAN